MKIVRYADSTTGDPAYGIVEGDTVYAASGDLFGGLEKGDAVGALSDLTIVTPLDFLRVPATALLGFWLYGEGFDIFTIIGAALILSANTLNLLKARRA